jgi:hypothetical protein
VPQSLYTKAFPKKTGGGEVFVKQNHGIFQIRLIFQPAKYSKNSKNTKMRYVRLIFRSAAHQKARTDLEIIKRRNRDEDQNVIFVKNRHAF